MTPRKHAELIKAWADGAEIQVKSPNCDRWYDLSISEFQDHQEYRIKPVPKPDYALVGWVAFPCRKETALVSVTFSGETGEAKKVEIVK